MNMRTKNKTALAGALAVWVLLAGGFAVSAQGEEALDSEITSAINTEMWIDDAVNANNIDVSTQDGIVTLTGAVDNLLAKDRAEAMAAATVGVRAIINRIKVEHVQMRSNKELKQAVKEALMRDPATESYDVDVAVDDGNVTLTGSADSYAEKELAASVAKGIQGVKSITNNIIVDYDIKRTDTEIKNEIEKRLENDVRVDDYMLNVEVDDGEVELSGTAGSLQEKNQAIDNAWVAGVTVVEADGIKVKSWARDKMRRTRKYGTMTDEQIEEAVNDAFVYDPRLVSFKVDVQADDGTVTLNGKVDNLTAKKAAEKDARNTHGVWRVKNHIKVRPETPENEELEDRVTNALVQNPYTESYQIAVESRQGWVYLSGNVNTSFEKNEAERVAEKTKGVVGVVNNLDFDHQWIWKPDREIRSDVRDQLEWSPFVNEDNIAITVHEGLVTLSGTVDSWSAREDAEKNAYQGGAKDVKNNLAVDYPQYGPYGPGYYGSPAFHGPGYYGPEYEPYE